MRNARYEVLEDRRMLASDADIIFLVDKSSSLGTEYDWIADIVTRPGGLDDFLKAPAQNISPRYGLVGFGNDQLGAFGHSHLLDVNDVNSDGDTLFGDSTQLSVVAEAVINSGSNEDVWDAIEHTIAEYNFREGAAVILVAFRRDDNVTFAGNSSAPTGTQSVSAQITRDGVIDAMKSYNASLNTIVVAEFDPLLGEYVLGIEADEADGNVNGEQIAHVVNPTSNQPTSPDFVQASHNGSASGAGTAIDTGTSIRIARSGPAELAGPSVAGYRAQALASSAFEDISASQNLLTLTTANTFQQLTTTELGAGFSFEFFDVTHTDLFVNGDGSITFGSESFQLQEFTDWTDANTPPQIPRIAPLWNDYELPGSPGPDGEVYWELRGTGPQERLIVQWQNFIHEFGAQDSVTFQATLYLESGDVIFSYDDLDVGNPAFDGGASATVGVATDAYQFPDTIPAGIFIDGVHVINETPNGVEDDLVRLAWESGGAAWNNLTIPVMGQPSQVSEYVDDFDQAFVESIGAQILRKHAAGEVVFPDDALLEINVGGPSIGAFIGDTAFEQFNSIDIYPNDTMALMAGGAIVANGNSMNDDPDTLEVFETARRSQFEEDFIVDLPESIIQNGKYVVELMFAELDLFFGFRHTDVFLEDRQMLELYNIRGDHAKIPSGFGGGPGEFEVLPTDLDGEVPVVKRYFVDVVDGNGLQISLVHNGNGPERSPLLNGLRVLNVPGGDLPTITDVRLVGAVPGSEWTALSHVSFAQRVEIGEQLRPLAQNNINQLEIHFNRDVSKLSGGTLDGSELQLNYTEQIATGGVLQTSLSVPGTDFNFQYDNSNAFVARWTFTNPLPSGKYAIHLSDEIVDGALNRIDVDWQNESGIDPVTGDPTWDDYTDDPTKSFADDMANGSPGSENGEFRFHFAILIGDFNGDGRVAGDDQVEWQRRVGPGQYVSTADSNGDGVIDNLDLADWQANNSSLLPLRKMVGADVTNDEIVDAFDFARWESEFGLPGGGSDVDGDGDSDGDDLILLQQALWTFSAWYVGPPMINFGNALATQGLPPQVINVIVSGSASTHAPYSFDAVDGSGEQLRTVPVGGADTISIVFSEDVNVSQGSLVVVGLSKANLPDMAEFHYDPISHTATWRFEGWALGDQYLISLSDMVTDTEGNRLDGEWTNPYSMTTTNGSVSSFPSGDQTAGGRFNFVATLLAGDANLDGIVDITDLGILSSNYDEQFGQLFEDGDFDGDGDVDDDDMQQLSASWYENLQDVWVLADFDGDFDVDDDDITTITDNLGMSGADYDDGDLNGDGEVDLDDLDLAFAQYALDIDLVA